MASNTPNGWGFAEVAGANPGPTPTNVPNTTYTAATGTATTGETYSFGSATAPASSDRGFGQLRSGSVASILGAKFTNDTGNTINSLAVSYAGEQWRLGATGRSVAERMDFQYSTTATSLTTGTWVDANGLDFTPPNNPTSGSAAALDGNLAANRSLITSAISGLNIPAGGTLWIRWTDVDATGADDGLAIDDFSIVANPSTPSLSISDVTLNEGDGGQTAFNFNVTLSSAAGPGGVAFQVDTADGTATTADGDYTAVHASRNIPQGENAATVTVLVNGDTKVEGDETFTVNLSNVSAGATVADGVGLGTIQNDDSAPVATNVLINEVDSDTPGTDAAEFVELYDGGAGNTSLNGLVLVFYNGSDDKSYFAISLNGITTNASGYATIGNSGVPGVTAAGTFNGNGLQNGQDAVALYAGSVANFPNGTAVTTTGLVDALVYDTSDADDPGLLSLLNASQPQADENVNGSSDVESSQRCPNGSGGARNTSSYAQHAPTPNAANICPAPQPTSPSGTGSANPSTVQVGGSTVLTVNVTPGANPASTGIVVKGDLSSIGGSASTTFSGSGNTFTFNATVPAGTATGAKTIPITITDAQSRTGSTSIALTVSESAAVPGGAVVISQVYGGGGNQGGIYKNDYIEIFNRSTETVVMNNWSVQHARGTDTTWSDVTTFSATLAPGQYFLIKQAAGTSCNGSPCGGDLTAWDAEGNIAVASTSGKVALVNNSTPLTGSCPVGGSVVDFLGYGTVNCSEGYDSDPGDNSGPGLSNTTAAFRVGDGCTDTNSNAADFTADAPAPRYSGSPLKNCEGVLPPTGESDSTVVISQVYAGGGNSGAAYTHDYVELYNRGAVPVDVTGWSLQYASATGSNWDFTKQPLGGTIAPGEYYLVSLASGGSNGSALTVTPNVSGEFNISATAGKLALVKSFDGLSGNCPLSSPSLADFVGYGSTADCGEGNKKAPSPGAASALYRRNGGATDSDNNQSDFEAAEPSPRRTAPIVEIRPYILGTDPRPNAAAAPRDASITVNFTEPVTVSGQWYNILCATTGLHDSATVAGGPKTFIITPNVSFVNGEQCTVTIYKNQVSDVDVNDGPETDTPPADYVWSFNTSTGTAPPYPAGVHLAMGNPSNATADITSPNNYLMSKPEFALSYSRDRGTPNWVSWHLSDEWVGSLTRVDTFRPDPAVPAEWYRVLHTDYSGSGFDRGHMVPNADRDKETSIPINQATFLMTNMLPQAPDNNQGPWANLENYFRTLLPANELYIVAGGSGSGGNSGGGVVHTIAGGKVAVPSQTWKVALVIPKGDDDLSRVTCGARAIAVVMPNVQGIRNEDWQNYITTVDDVETLTGYNLFSNLPDHIEACVEAGTNGVNPPGAADGAFTTAEDTEANVTLAGYAGSNPTLTYHIVTPPAHGTLSGTGANRVYTPDPDYNGTDSFTFNVTDGATPQPRTSRTATVSILVNEVNDAPAAAADSKTTQEDTALVFNASDLTANDGAGPSDEAGQALAVASVTAGAETHGTVTLSLGQVTYTPEDDYNGPASFTYEVCDNGTTAGNPDAKCASATVNVTVTSVNDGPTLAPIPDTAVLVGGTVAFTAVGADVDQQALTYSLVGPAHGATINPTTGDFSWTPTAAQGGQAYTFTVSVSDGSLSAQDSFEVAVGYTWSGFLQPINQDGSSIFKLGRTVPVKFQLTGASAGVTDAVVRLYVAKVTDNVVGTAEEADSTSNATEGNLFRYADGQYAFNLSTAGLTPGTYQLRVGTDGGDLGVVNISLR